MNLVLNSSSYYYFVYLILFVSKFGDLLKSLQLGGICTDSSGAICCKDTKMILSSADVQRIIGCGYKKEDFCFLDEEGFTRLHNIEGNCFFLRENKCIIYSSRPQGCKFYPIIFDLDNNKAIVDSECPLADTISSKIVITFTKDLRKFIRKIMEENE